MASASRKAQDLKAKEAKQKKILAVGLVLFIGLMAIQMPKLMNRGGNAAAAPPVPTPTATPAPADPSSLAPPVVGGAGSATAGASGATGSSSGLADTDVAPAPAAGQLVQFDLFASKDPFVQQVTDVASSPAPPAPANAGSAGAPSRADASETPTTTTATPGAAFAGAPPTPASAEPMTTVARVTVNGVLEQLTDDATFPASAPTFRLVSFTSGEIALSVVEGQYQSGAPTLKIKKGRSVTLMNTADGSKYRIVYLGARKVPAASLPQPVAPTTTATEGAATTPTATPPVPAATPAATTTTQTTPPTAP